jgi:hypothetical protein
MKAFLIIDTEDKREKVEVTNKQVNSLIPFIKKINNGYDNYSIYDGYELFKEIYPNDENEITSINIVYHN